MALYDGEKKKREQKEKRKELCRLKNKEKNEKENKGRTRRMQGRKRDGFLQWTGMYSEFSAQKF